jgi:hypothetical protein
LAFDSTGNLYVASFYDNAITKWTSDGRGSVFVTNGLSKPVGIAFDSLGYLYAVNQGNNTIEEFSPTGEDLGPFATTGMNSPLYIGIQDDRPPPSILLVLSGFSSGGFILSGSGTTGFICSLEASTNLLDWVTISTNTVPFQFTDVNASNYITRFYRASPLH